MTSLLELEEWEARSGYTRHNLATGFLEWRSAFWEFCDLVGADLLLAPDGSTASSAAWGPKNQLRFWAHYMRYFDGHPDAKTFCIDQINRLRGR